MAPHLPPRVRLALGVGLGCLVGVLAVVVLAGGPGPTTDLQLVEGFAGAQRPPQIPPDDFALRDQDGHRVRLSDYAGRVVILAFLYSTCQDTCPLIAQQIRGALDQLGRPVPALAISVDPSADTPLNARRFLVKQSVAGRLRFLLGSRAELAPVWRGYFVKPQTPGSSSRSDHTVDVVLVDKAGRQRIGFPSDQLTPEALAHDIRRLVAEPPPTHPPARVQL
jgi:protein SCO1/2